MKTKKIFKIFTIITMLMLAIFTTGCESQQEKYTKASNELAEYEVKFMENLKAKSDKNIKELEELQKSNIDKTLAERHGAELLDKQVDIMDKSFDEYLKNVKERLENLQKIAKGNPELEKDVQNKWNKYNKDRKDFSATKMLMRDKIEEIKQEMKQEMKK